jgi:5'-deoxynucleotidase YfbR-like HD superfamily hydrolase
MFDKIKLLNKTASVSRWGGKHMLYPSNVLEHTARVQYITHLLLNEYSKYKSLDYKIAYDAMSYASEHDVLEALTNDIPYSIKKKYPKLKEALQVVEESESIAYNLISPSEVSKTIVKLADIVDVMYEAKRELLFGNSQKDFVNIDTAVSNMITAISKTIDSIDSGDFDLIKLLDITKNLISDISRTTSYD